MTSKREDPHRCHFDAAVCTPTLLISMRLLTSLSVLAGVISWAWTGNSIPTSQIPLFHSSSGGASGNITAKLFYELEELSRIVDISYCVGTTGIQKPFLCASRCEDFEGFDLVSVGDNQAS